MATAEMSSQQSPQIITAEVDDYDRKESLALSRASRAGLLANITLLLGYIFGLWFTIYEFNDRDRETVAIVVYFLAFALLVISGIIELSVDVFSQRTVGHGRYHSDSARWNRVISILFISAGILDIVAFVYWMRWEPDVENVVLSVSSYLLLVMSILALYFHIKDLQSESWAEAIISDKIDLMANVLVFVITVVGVVLGHMENSDIDYGNATDQMELALVSLWLFSSVLYVTTDVIRLSLIHI